MKFSLLSDFNVCEVAVNQSLVRIEAGETYSTDDVDEISALSACPALRAEPDNKKKPKDGDGG